MAANVIAAIATASGQAGIGVVRLSGAGLGGMIQPLTQRAHLKPRHATLCDFHDAAGAVIDRGIALFFPAPRSYTGDDVLELHGHGGPVILRALLRRCLELGARPADAGEFTRRAYLNGKLDLAQAEAVADVIAASTDAAARCAQRSLAGLFSQRVNDVVAALIEQRAMIEAALDFPDEETDALERYDIAVHLRDIRSRLHHLLRCGTEGARFREGMRLVIAGRPNAGKSSLLNRMMGEERAIVSAIPGTTRDVLRESLQLRGVPLTVVDTAGLHSSDDPLDRMGMERSWREVGTADVLLLVVDQTIGCGETEQNILRTKPDQVPALIVFNKIDLARDGAEFAIPNYWGYPCVGVSAKTGAGMDSFDNALGTVVGVSASSGEDLFMARERHLDALKLANECIERAMAETQEARLELLAEELRLAQEALGSITGAISSDELLGEIFRRFCIGK